MSDFEKLYTEFERTKNVCQFCEDHWENDAATRFLLIRSLDKDNLKDIIKKYSTADTKGKFPILTERAYNSSVTIDQLLSYIESQRAPLIRQREAEIEGLEELLMDFPIVSCGVRNDNIDDIVKKFVRNKSLKNMDDFYEMLDDYTLLRIRQYIMWSYYNQTANDIVELFLLRHPYVIPTLRKIHDIDFFLKLDGKIIPFDLKFTHISDEYFNLASQGILPNNNPLIHDNFYVADDPESNELKRIKAYYRDFRKEHRELGLPKMSGLDKNDICRLLINTGDRDAAQFVHEMKQEHENYVPSTPDELYKLEWWNYKYQGERLFCNNNRFFVFLSYLHEFVDGRELKGKTAKIGREITALLDGITASDIHTVKYHYDKDANRKGDYTALSISAIYYE